MTTIISTIMQLYNMTESYTNNNCTNNNCMVNIDSRYKYNMYMLENKNKSYNNTYNETPVAKSKKSKNATNVYYKPNIKNKEIRYSNLSNRTLRY